MAYNDHGRGGKRFGGGRRPPMQMHQAICSECEKSCEVPFRPSGDKPVFCSDCFKGKNNDSRGERSGGRDFGRHDSRGGGGGRRSYGDRDYAERPPVEMHEAVCSDCGKECEVPFKPSGDKPIYCDKCFGRNKEVKSARPSAGGNSKLDEKLTMINIKLDRILKVLDAGASNKVNKEVKEAKEAKAPTKPEAKSLIKKVKPSKTKVKAAKK
ncbi:hypothetical protein A3B60_00530 [Candidatus Peregrinibacteria bacterium RIFCSPLOWO2_01_FULL_39_12]|nr:MAG: hypothetical protein A3B60_00530 [Candidatus Peregrinibacteria bacterium RIFCSPLOWO2_01_FULL_39_12]